MRLERPEPPIAHRTIPVLTRATRKPKPTTPRLGLERHHSSSAQLFRTIFWTSLNLQTLFAPAISVVAQPLHVAGGRIEHVHGGREALQSHSWSTMTREIPAREPTLISLALIHGLTSVSNPLGWWKRGPAKNMTTAEGMHYGATA